MHAFSNVSGMELWGVKVLKKSLLLAIAMIASDSKLSVFLWQGGGWCNSVRSCVYRKKTRRGSSNYMEKQIPFTGILSNRAEENPGPLVNDMTSSILRVSRILWRFPYCFFSVRRFFQLE